MIYFLLCTMLSNADVWFLFDDNVDAFAWLWNLYIVFLFIYFFVNISSKDVINGIFWMPLLTTSSLGTSGGWLFTSTSNQGTSRNWACFGGKVEKEKSSHLWPVAYDFQGYFIWGIIFLFYTMQLLTPNVSNFEWILMWLIASVLKVLILIIDQKKKKWFWF